MTTLDAPRARVESLRDVLRLERRAALLHEVARTGGLPPTTDTQICTISFSTRNSGTFQVSDSKRSGVHKTHKGSGLFHNTLEIVHSPRHHSLTHSQTPTRIAHRGLDGALWPRAGAARRRRARPTASRRAARPSPAHARQTHRVALNVSDSYIYGTPFQVRIRTYLREFQRARARASRERFPQHSRDRIRSSPDTSLTPAAPQKPNVESSTYAVHRVLQEGAVSVVELWDELFEVRRVPRRDRPPRACRRD